MPKCLSPRALASGIVVSCSRCPHCRLTNAQSWIFRLQEEQKRHASAFFVTLTYAEVKRTTSNFPTLVKSDVQQYFKNLRNEDFSRYGVRRPIRYYAVGEYGGRTNRPHYHAIVFGADYDLLQSAWRDRDCVIGSTFIGTVSAASIQYVTKYLCKPHWQRKHSADDRLPHFSLMSKGLGSNYLTDEVIQYHKADLSRNFVLDSSGRKVSMPRYFKKLMYNADELLAIADHMKSLSVSRFLKKQARYLKRFGNLTGFAPAEDWRSSYLLRSKFAQIQSSRISL